MRVEEALAKLQEAAKLAAARGSLIFHLDLATEMARLAFAGRGIVPVGLATLVDELGYRIFAFDTPPRSQLLAEARFDRAGNTVILPRSLSAPPHAILVAEVRETIAALREDDSLDHVPIVIPAAGPNLPLEGYKIAISDDADRVRLAGHWHLTLDATGRRIVSRSALVASHGPAACDVRVLRERYLVCAGATPNALHTYLSLKHDMPLQIETQESGLHWRIDGEDTKIILDPADRAKLSG